MTPQTRPSVLILVGSESDLPTIQAACDALEAMGIAWSLEVSSAHRAPERTVHLTSTARERGFSAIIAAAGLAAHLPGVVASHTTLPVIGVPIGAGPLRGADALPSIVQMPKGVPVACVAIDGAWNAGLLAARIIGATNADVAARLEQYRDELAKAFETPEPLGAAPGGGS